ncbi:hypothetical protein GCM10012284_25750 [Mangrovihabitans endophyticus]|uniref:Uncharacterized protein n=1 Tax=Mangrovihabitans endophyticus TaxID=1751298 RepID=A0A8J3FPK2_9ACTN|nr:hypothetical protein GCM10012284_25750 [Mangrovihabitans endophyticus]
MVCGCHRCRVTSVGYGWLGAVSVRHLSAVDLGISVAGIPRFAQLCAHTKSKIDGVGGAGRPGGAGAAGRGGTGGWGGGGVGRGGAVTGSRR